MWIILSKPPRPDAPNWPGRRWLAAVDAVAWPALCVWLVMHSPLPAGAVGQLVGALSVVLAIKRLHRALWANHRYRFTTWRWGKVLASLVLIGGLLKLAVSV
jgi:hypothetical protein